jgi:predicted  nucleic acid-binding Zn-ribbon protein
VQLTEARTRLEDVETKLANATKKLSQQQDYVETAVSMQDQLAKVTQELQDSKNKEMQQIKAITQLNQDIRSFSLFLAELLPLIYSFSEPWLIILLFCVFLFGR